MNVNEIELSKHMCLTFMDDIFVNVTAKTAKHVALAYRLGVIVFV